MGIDQQISIFYGIYLCVVFFVVGYIANNIRLVHKTIRLLGANGYQWVCSFGLQRSEHGNASFFCIEINGSG